MQGEGGVVPAPEGYLRAAREITRATGTLLVLDEVQTGVGRTGHWFAHQADRDVDPDVVTLAKGLGGGLPIGVAVAFGSAARLLGPGQHGSTFGGNPIACAAGLAVLRTVEAEGCSPGPYGPVSGCAGGSRAGAPRVAGVRGAGLLLGVVLTEPRAAQVQRAAQDAGFLVNAAGPATVRLAPALTVTDGQIDGLVEALAKALDA